MKAQVICRTGSAAGLTKSCGDTTRIGRDEANEVCIPHDQLSRLHATISRTAGTFWLVDGGSTNGTFLNGRRITKERLRAFDVISLARQVDLIFLVGQYQLVSSALNALRVERDDGLDAAAAPFPLRAE